MMDLHLLLPDKIYSEIEQINYFKFRSFFTDHHNQKHTLFISESPCKIFKAKIQLVYYL